MKLWEKTGTKTSKDVEAFTVGKDREMDLYLAEFDVYVNIAHSYVLKEAGLITDIELTQLRTELIHIHKEVTSGKFKLDEGVEDVHSQIEFLLTKKLGDTGKKIHTARSRNDQVLTCIKLFLRDEIKKILLLAHDLSAVLLNKSEEYRDALMPGYTHLQVAMPSSFGMWLGAYAEEIINNIEGSHGLYDVINKNPLGSGAGFGSSFPIDRELSTELLGFESLHINVINAQMARGENEKYAAMIISFLAHTLSRLAYDICLYCNQNYGFISLPDAFTTGSSIMPHKKNPDVLELIRAKCNLMQSIPNSINMVANNLPTGYHRDYQILKEILFPAFDELSSCMGLMAQVVEGMKVNKNIVEDAKYKYLFSVEEVNKLVLQGVPFREAYKRVGDSIESGDYKYSTTVSHSHIGSIGNLGNELLKRNLKSVIESYNFENITKAYQKLIG